MLPLNALNERNRGKETQNEALGFHADFQGRKEESEGTFELSPTRIEGHDLMIPAPIA